MSLSDKPPSKSIEDLFEIAQASVAAETLLTAMGPQLEKGMELRMKELFEAPPELGALLDARAKIKAVWDLQVGLIRDAKRGSGAVKIFQDFLAKSA